MPLKARAGILIKRPALGAMIAGRLRPVERSFALAPIEAAEMAARERRPDDALLVDVGAADAEARQRNVVDLRERRLRGIRPRNDAHDRARESPHGTPDRAVGRTRHHGVEAGHDPLVFRRIHRLIGLDVLVALAVAVGVEDQRRPALRFRRVAGLVEYLHVEPADDRSRRRWSTTCRWRRTANDASRSRCRRRCTSWSWDRASKAGGSCAPPERLWPKDGPSLSCRKPDCSDRGPPPRTTRVPCGRTCRCGCSPCSSRSARCPSKATAASVSLASPQAYRRRARVPESSWRCAFSDRGSE